MDKFLQEAKRLYNLGWAVHWIKPNSKAPVKAGWSGPVRDPWIKLCKSYVLGYGLGVRLGEASKLPEGGYLANIDVDLKSTDPKHHSEAGKRLRELFSEIPDKAPVIYTGAGFRLVVRTKEPAESRRLASSSDKVDYFGTKKDAWQIEFMSTGKQVVLPPSIHPERRIPYLWENGSREKKIPLIKPPAGVASKKLGNGKNAPNFLPVEIEPELTALPSRVISLINGDGVEDRSAACFAVALSMVKAKFGDDEIKTVLTDPNSFLGQTAYEHAQTNNRARAAHWVQRYCITKARASLDASRAFRDEVTVSLVAEGKADEDAEEEPKPEHWSSKIKRTAEGGPPVKSLQNVVIILQNDVASDVFRRDLFALRDSYSCDTPWGGKKGEALSDDDAVKIRLWLGQKWRFEPAKDLIFDAMTSIATSNAFHPIRDELNALPEWDAKCRLDTWLAEHFEAKGPREYLAQVFRKWMVAAVTRIFEPGAKFDWILLLEGGQGTGKSSFASILFGEDYFADWLPQLSDKDAALSLQGIRCVEFAELDQLRRNELETTKAFITRRIDKVRPPYGKRWLESRRQCVFLGTTNKPEYLKDDSGNRRFNPAEVGKLDFGALKKDRIQLWAEALYIYRNGLEESLYLDNGAELYARQIQAKKMVIDDANVMAEQIKRACEKDPSKFERFSLLELFEGGGALHEWKADGRTMQFAAKALKLLNFKKVTVKGSTRWRYLPTPPTPRKN